MTKDDDDALKPHPIGADGFNDAGDPAFIRDEFLRRLSRLAERREAKGDHRSNDGRATEETAP